MHAVYQGAITGEELFVASTSSYSVIFLQSPREDFSFSVLNLLSRQVQHSPLQACGCPHLEDACAPSGRVDPTDFTKSC